MSHNFKKNEFTAVFFRKNSVPQFFKLTVDTSNENKPFWVVSEAQIDIRNL